MLNTRIPRELRRRVRLLCAEAEREMQDFIASAIEKKLLRLKRGRRRATSG